MAIYICKTSHWEKSHHSFNE